MFKPKGPQRDYPEDESFLLVIDLRNGLDIEFEVIRPSE